MLIASVLGIAAARADDADVKIGKFIPAEPPQPAPEVSFTDDVGANVALADFRGRFLIVNLWATWCQPCLKEMPSLAALQQRIGPALAVLAISEDRAGEDVVKPFAAKLSLDKLLKIYLDPKSAVGRAFGARGLPTSIVIDRDGLVLGKVEGQADWDSEAMRARLATLMPPDVKR